MRLLLCLIVTGSMISVLFAGPHVYDVPQAKERKADRALVATAIQEMRSAKANVDQALVKLDTSITGLTNGIAEAKALPSSDTKKALVDVAQGTKDLAEATKQNTQALRDVIQAIRKMEKDDTP